MKQHYQTPQHPSVTRQTAPPCRRPPPLSSLHRSPSRRCPLVRLRVVAVPIDLLHLRRLCRTARFVLPPSSPRSRCVRAGAECCGWVGRGLAACCWRVVSLPLLLSLSAFPTALLRLCRRPGLWGGAGLNHLYSRIHTVDRYSAVSPSSPPTKRLPASVHEKSR